MKLKTVTILQASRHKEKGYMELMRSLDNFGYDHYTTPRYRWFGDKMIYTAEYLETIENDYTHFLFVDGTDVFALDGPETLIERYCEMYGDDKIVMSCEKACWPDPTLAEKYPTINSEWRYINSGSYIAPIDAWLKMWEENKVPYIYDDQLWHHERFLSGKYPFELDFGCLIFQSIAHKANDDYKIEGGRLLNQKTETKPIIIHGNGKSPMEWIYELI